MEDGLATVEHAKNTLVELAVNFGPKVLAGLAVLGAGLLISHWLGRWLARALRHFELEPPVRLLLVRLVRALMLGLFVIMALQNLGIQLLPLIAGLGVAGAGIALAMQGVLSNVVAGLTIIFSKPFRVGEYISVVGEEGLVSAISLFSTTLEHLDRSHVVIPNRKLVGEILHNYGNIRQLDLSVGIAYDADLERVRGVIDGVLAGNALVLAEPAPVIRTLRLEDSAVRIGVLPWVAVADYGDAVDAINRELLAAFRARGVEIAAPRREVRLMGEPALSPTTR